MAGRSLRGPAAPLLLVVGVILGLAGLRSLGLVTLLPAGGPTGDGPGEVLASRPIDLERARAAPALPRSVPTRIQIPAIQVDSVGRFPRARFPHLAGVRTARLPRSAPGHLRWPVRLPASPVPGQRHGLRQRPWVTR